MTKIPPAPNPPSNRETAENEITRILQELNDGDPRTTEALIPLVYNELRHLAAYRLAQDHNAQTLQATALVHEAYLRLLTPEEQNWSNRRHFFSAAAEAMRRILIENARRKRAVKRGGDLKRSDIDVDDIPHNPTSVDILDLNEAVQDLEQIDPGAAELVKLRYFAGLTMKQVAEVLGVKRRAAENIWAFAKAWFFDFMTKAE